MEPQDTITIAPSVLIAIARHAAEQVRGVAGMGQIPVGVGRLFGGQPLGPGVILDIDGDDVAVDLYLRVKPGANMKETGTAAQHAVQRAIQDLVGMEVTRVTVHIEDVDYAAGK